MKNLAIILVLILYGNVLTSCTQTTAQNKSRQTGNATIEAYYFHFTARCVTCRTVESGTKENLEILYPDQTKTGLITFRSVNLDEESGQTLAKKLGIAGQTLLLVKGDQKIDITNEGFMYAVSKPDKFKEIIKEKVGILLSR